VGRVEDLRVSDDDADIDNKITDGCGCKNNCFAKFDQNDIGTHIESLRENYTTMKFI